MLVNSGFRLAAGSLASRTALRQTPYRSQRCYSSRTNSSGAESSRTKARRPESSRPESSGTELSRTESPSTEPSKTESSSTELVEDPFAEAREVERFGGYYQQRERPPMPTDIAKQVKQSMEEYHGTSGGVGPKGSMWTAPQSLMYPTALQRTRPFDQRLADKYFRRVTKPHKWYGPPPAMWQRQANIVGMFLAFTIGVYMVVFADFGDREHVFSPIRRGLQTDYVNPFALSPEEKQWLEQRRRQDMERAGQS